MKFALSIAILLVGLSTAPAIEVTREDGRPLSTNMGWNPRLGRPSDEVILASSLGETLKSLKSIPHLTPDMLGDDSAEDDTELLRWAILSSRALGVPLWINHAYGFSQPLEIQNNQEWFGNGGDSPGLFQVTSAIASRDLQEWRDAAPAIVQAPDAKTFTIRDLHIDGRQSSVDWQAIRHSWPSRDRLELSNFLRNSPSFAGLAFTNHGRRELPDRAYLRRVHVHDTLSSCMLAQCEVVGEDIRLGNTVSGRILYRFQGLLTGLHTYGFTRSSIARINPPTTIIGWQHRDRGFENPWPENETAINVAAIETLPDSEGQVQLLGIDWDLSGSRIGLGIKVNGNCTVTGSMRNLGAERGHIFYGGSGISIAKFDLQTVNCAAPTIRGAQYRNLDLRWVNRNTESLERGTVPIRIDVRRPIRDDDHEQRLRLHVDNPERVYTLIHFADLYNGAEYPEPHEIVPTYIRLSGRFNNRSSTFFSLRRGLSEQTLDPPDGWFASLPINVIFEDVQCNVIDPPRGGDLPWTSQSELIEIWHRSDLR